MLDLSKAARSTPHIKTSTTKKRQWETVEGDSLLRGPETRICEPDMLFREVCCLMGACIRMSPRDYQALYGPLLSTGVVSHMQLWYSQEQSEEYQDGLQSCGSSGKGLLSAGSFFFNPPGQRERIWKGQSNMVNPQIVTGLMPQPGVLLFRLWDSLWGAWSTEDWWDPAAREEQHLQS